VVSEDVLVEIGVAEVSGGLLCMNSRILGCVCPKTCMAVCSCRWATGMGWCSRRPEAAPVVRPGSALLRKRSAKTFCRTALGWALLSNMAPAVAKSTSVFPIAVIRL